MSSPDMYVNSEQSRDEVAALIEGVNSVLRCDNLQDAAKALFESCKKLVGAECGYVSLLDGDRNERNQALYIDPGMQRCTNDPSLPMPVRGMHGMAYQTGRPLIDNDFRNNASQKLLPAGHAALSNVLFAPLRSGGVPIGLLGLANKPGGFNDNDIRLATAFGDLAAVALQKSKAIEALADRERVLRHLMQHEVIERRRAEELYRILFNGGNDAIYVYRMKDGQPEKMVEVNDTGLRSLGYAREEFISMPIGRFVSKDIMGSNAWKVFWRSIATNGHAMLESIHVTKAGQEIPVEVNAHVLEYEGKSLVISIARDITARKKAQYELKRQLDFEKLIRLISARFINGDIKKVDEYIMTSLQEVSDFLVVDRSFIYRITENREEAVLSHSWSRADNLFDIPRTVNLLNGPYAGWKRRLEKGEPVYIDESEATEEDKAPLAALEIKSGLIVPMVCDGKLVGVLGYSHVGEAKERNARKAALCQMIGEIFASTMRRKLELERLEKSEAASRALLRSVPDILLRVNKEGRLLDYQLAKGKQLSVKDNLKELPVEYWPPMMEKIQAAISTDEVQCFEYDLQLNNRLPQIEEARVVGIDDSEALIMIRDVTEARQAQRKTAEAELKMIKAQKLATLGVMAAGIAHEINQPLHSIKLAASGVLYLQKIGVQSGVDELMEEFEKISDEADRIADVMSSIKALCKNNAILAPTDVNAAIESSLSLMAPKLQAGSIAIEKQLSPECLSILGSFTQLEQVVTNLIKNAVQVLEQTESATKRIVVTTIVSNGLAIVEISDNGSGINPQDLDRLFDPFFSTKSNAENMGLGLPIVQAIVSSWSGKIDVFNNEYGGATFRLEFPVYAWKGEINANLSG
ncbi:MAG: domain S-box-containing protein [Anaerosporomusa subterranea]|nr:domain S-box-containing protein [Anaerosporomusa subterranea]